MSEDSPVKLWWNNYLLEILDNRCNNNVEFSQKLKNKKILPIHTWVFIFKKNLADIHFHLVFKRSIKTIISEECIVDTDRIEVMSNHDFECL